MLLLQRRFTETAIEVSEWISSYILRKTMMVITYPCPNLS